MGNTVKLIDMEWVELIDMARRIGLTVDEIRDYLQNSGRVKAAEHQITT